MDHYQNNYNCYNQVVATNYNRQTITSQSLSQNNWNISSNCTSRSIYINQNFQRKQNLPVISNKVLINPNFLGPPKVHINPSYIKTKTIFINPHLITNPTNQVQTKTLANDPKNASDVLVSTKNKWVRKSSKPSVNNISAISSTQSTSKFLKTPLKYTKYKIIREDTTSKRKRRTSINLRYKLIRSNSSKSKSLEKHIINNKFKLDRRNSSERIKSKLYSLNKAYRMKVDHKNAILKRVSVTSNKVTAVKVVNVKRGTARMSRILNISGRKYKMDNNKMVLKLAMTGDVNTSKRTVKIVRRGEQINKIPLRKAFRTNNIPCPTYHRFGVCQRHNRGMCQKVHNPDQIALCSKFLQGVCHNDVCPLSHKISASKIATCKFYLEGLCTKDGCPYLHVKVNSKVAICKEFLAGFCQLGKECDKRHEFLCPDFEFDGRCRKRKCQLPHKNAKRQSTDRLKSVRKQVKYNMLACNKEASQHVKSSSKVVGSSNIVISSDLVDSSSSKRYYQEDMSTNNNNNSAIVIEEVSSTNVAKCKGNFVIVDKMYSIKVDEGSVIISNDLLLKRPLLGTLPTFIPFN